MSYLKYREKVFGIKTKSPYTLKRRSSGRLKTIDSATDCRAWGLDDEERRDYILETIARPTCHSGKFIPPEVVLGILKETQKQQKSVWKRKIRKRAQSEENLYFRKKCSKDVRQLREVIKELDFKVDDLSYENENLKSLAKAKNQEIKQLKNSISDLSSKIKQNDRLESENTKLKTEVGPDLKKAFLETQSALTVLSTKLEEKSREYDELLQENEKLKSENINELKEQLAFSQSKIDELEENLKTSKRIQSGLRDANSTNENKYVSLTKLIARQRDELLSIQKDMGILKAKFFAKEAKHKEYVSQLKFLCTIKVHEIKKCLGRLKCMEDVCLELEKTRDQLNSNNISIMDNLHYYRTHFYTLVDVNKRLCRSIDSLKEDLNETKLELQKKSLIPRIGLSIVHMKLLEGLLFKTNIEDSQSIGDMKNTILSAKKILLELKSSSNCDAGNIMLTEVTVQTEITIKHIGSQYDWPKIEKSSQIDWPDEYEVQCKESHETVVHLTCTIQDMERSLLKEQDKVNLLKNEISSLRYNLNMKVEEINNLKTAFEKTAKQLQNTEKGLEEINELKEKILLLEKQSIEKETELQFLVSDKFNLEGKLMSLGDDLKTYKKLESKLRDVVQECYEKEALLVEAKKDKELLQEEVYRRQADYNEVILMLKNSSEDLKKLKEQNELLSRDIAVLKGPNNLDKDGITKLKSTFEETINVLRMFNKIVSDASEGRWFDDTNIDELKLCHCHDPDVLIKAATSLKTLQNNLKNFEELKNEMEGNLNKSSIMKNKYKTRYNRKIHEITQLQHYLRKLKGRVRVLSAQVRVFKRCKSDKADSETVQRLIQENKELVRSVETMKHLICDLEKCIQSKNSLVTAAICENEELKRELNEKDLELTRQNKCKVSLVSKCTNTECNEPQVQNEIEELRSHTMELSEMLKSLEQQMKIKTEGYFNKSIQVNFKPSSNEVKAIKEAHAKELEALKSNFEKEKEIENKTHLSNLQLVRDNYDREIKRMQKEHNDSIKKLQMIHSEELESLRTMREEGIFNQRAIKEEHSKEMEIMRQHYESLLREQEMRLQNENYQLRDKLDKFIDEKEIALNRINEKVIHEINGVKHKYKKKIKSLNEAHRQTMSKLRTEFTVRLERERIQDRIKLQKEKSHRLSVVKQDQVELVDGKDTGDQADKGKECEQIIVNNKTMDTGETAGNIKEVVGGKEIIQKLDSELDYQWKIQCRLRDEYNRAEMYMRKNLELTTKLSKLDKRLREIEGEVKNERLKATHLRLKSKLDIATDYLNRNCEVISPREAYPHKLYDQLSPRDTDSVISQDGFSSDAVTRDGSKGVRTVNPSDLTVKFIQQCGILHSWNKTS